MAIARDVGLSSLKQVQGWRPSAEPATLPPPMTPPHSGQIRSTDIADVPFELLFAPNFARRPPRATSTAQTLTDEL
jgi:hypothetical protein